MAGDNVAYAYALLRCGTEEELRKDPANRLRLTIGLRKQGGRWLVAHEHHSFPRTPGDLSPLDVHPAVRVPGAGA